MSGDGDLDGGISGSGGDGVLGAVALERFGPWVEERADSEFLDEISK